MRSRSLRATLTIGLAIAMMVCTAVFISFEAQAHEQRQVGDYTFTVGFLTEPAIVNEPNGLDLRVALGEGDAATPVEGLANTLQAEVSYGGESRSLELEPAFGEPGAYQAHFIPTAEGAYTFHITGDIEGTAVDESFTSGPETFAEVAGRETMNFPAQTDDADDDGINEADTALVVAIIGLALGIAALAAGIAAYVAVRRRSTAEPATGISRESVD